MKRIIILLTLATLPLVSGAYNDHRVPNLDSLERVAGRWTPQAIDNASEEELLGIMHAYRSLMVGFTPINADKAKYYSWKALVLARKLGWEYAAHDAARYYGLGFYGAQQYDSAMVYYSESLRHLEKMEAGATSPTQPEGYSQANIDDARSSLYGTLGNLYNMMDSIPKAMDYYAKAGEIFEKYGWNESNSILHYNMAETWLELGEMHKALPEYREGLRYAQEAGDSLLTASSYKGLGRYYLENGRNRKALRYLRKANEYYSSHKDQEFQDMLESSGYTSRALNAQKRQITWLAIVLAVLLAATALILILRRQRRVSATPKATAIKLSAREMEILQCIADGKTNTQIAEALFLSPETTKWYRKQLFAKFDAENAADLVRRAMEQKLLQ